MTAADFYSLAPYLTLAGALVVLLLVISFARSHVVAMLVALLGLVATVFAVLFTAGGEAHTTMHLLRLDGYAAFFNCLFLLAAIITVLLAYRYLIGRGGELEEFYILIIIATLGAMTMAGAHHFAAFVLGLEILSVALYALIAYPEEKHPPLEAALKYLVLSAVASTTILFGMALMYNATGSLYFAAVSDIADGSKLQLYLRVGEVMLFAGIAFKLSLVPFHMWTPDVYQGAPAPVTGFIATVSKGAVFALLLRWVVEGDSLSAPVVLITVSSFAVLSMIIGNVLALLQDNLKRLLAYSSIAHMGYLLIALLGVARLQDSQFAVETALVYLAAYTLMTLTAFAVITVMSNASVGDDAQTSEQYRGLFWRRPLPAICLAVALLSLTGMPLTLGFVAKFYLFAAGVQGAMWMLLWALILGSAISVYYYVRVIYVMTLPQKGDVYPHPRISLPDLSVVTLLGAVVVMVGVYPTPLIDVIRILIKGFGQ